MSRTEIDTATLARSLRRMAGDGSMEWVHEPIQARVLLDVADALDENAKLREFASELLVGVCDVCAFPPCDECEVYATARELGIEVSRLNRLDDSSLHRR